MSTTKVAKENPGGRELMALAAKLKFEPHDIRPHLDSSGRYEVPLDAEFPLLIKLFHYTSRNHTRGATWHERLELFLPLDAPARFRMGDEEVELSPGELLVVDNLKLHHVVDFPGFNTRVIVVSFLPEFVYTLGSPSHDYSFLLPFYSKVEQRPHVLRPRDAASNPVKHALAKLIQLYFAGSAEPLREAGCKAFLLELLYHLAAHFRESEVMKLEFERQRKRSLRFKKVFEHINARPGAKLSVVAAARMAGMNAPQFGKLFKKVSGLTLIGYLNHARLAHAARLLRESDQSIAEIAQVTGFADQSYFDKRFKRSFGSTPSQFRLDARRRAEPGARKS